MGEDGVAVASDDGQTTWPNVTAIVDAIADEMIMAEDGQTMLNFRTITLQTAEVPSPDRGYVITVEALPWTVDRVLSVQSGMACLRVVRPVQKELTAKNYRARQGRR